MRTIESFFPEPLFKELLDYSTSCVFKRREDGIYNFKGIVITGDLFAKVENIFRIHNLMGDIDVLRIQCIDPTVVVAKNYHHHHKMYKESIVCFLNEDFVGGEFEYDNEGVSTLIPRANTAIIFGPDLRHKVLPVIQGNRYTVVAFLAENSYFNKKEKTLI